MKLFILGYRRGFFWSLRLDILRPISLVIEFDSYFAGFRGIEVAAWVTVVSRLNTALALFDYFSGILFNLTCGD